MFLLKIASLLTIVVMLVKEKGSPYPTKSAMFSKQEACWSEDDEKGVKAHIDTC